MTNAFSCPFLGWRAVLWFGSLFVLLAGGCTASTTETRYDFDEDGIEDGADCSPADSSIYPGAEDPYGDQVDQDCDGADGVDADGDGFPSNVEGDPEHGHLQDCNDANALVYPGALDNLGDGVDHNCDSNDGVDADGDGEASTSSGGEDCDDENPDVSSSAVDPYGDDVDGDCDGGDGIDRDGDGMPANEEESGELWFDCDDAVETTHPGAADSVGDGIDNNCDGVDGIDADGDGHASLASGGQDCDDDANGIHPAASDPYAEGGDTNCDGADGVDADGDTYPGNEELAGEAVYDCNDTNAAVSPGATEVVNDGLDNDCDGIVHNDADNDGFLAEVDDCDDTNEWVHPEADEVCADELDNDCDGGIDDDASIDAGVWYLDEDEDSFGDSGTSLTACAQPDGYVDITGDCDDESFVTNPNATETCNGSDDNCDSSVDEGFDDTDGDSIADCVDLDDDGDTDPDATDCQDTNPWIYTGAEETANGEDDDCDGIVDEGTVNYDDDGDTFSEAQGDCDDTAADISGPGGVPDGVPDGFPYSPADPDGDGYTTCSAQADCGEGNGAINPGHPEICDGLDNNCDGQIPADENDDDGDGYRICEGDCDDDGSDSDGDGAADGAAITPYDGDEDGYSDCSNPVDCDDDDDEKYPSAAELCDGIDSDCAGDLATTEADGDGDGYALCSNPEISWSSVVGGDDCDDDNPDANPGSSEICNDGVDDDCDPATDEVDDADGDGASECSLDCDDTDSAIGPYAAELCADSIDNDCNGSVDDSCITCAVTVPTDQPTINDGLLTLTDGDTLCIAPGGYVENLSLPSFDHQIVGLEGSNLTSILGSLSDQQRLIEVTGGNTSATLLQGLFLSGGVALSESNLHTYQNDLDNHGGCLFVEDSGLTLKGMKFNNCVAGFGGAISASGSSLVMERVTIEQSSAQSRGGGVFVYDSSLDASDLVLDFNFASQHGGGLFATAESDLSLVRLLVTINVAGASGAGIACDDTSSGSDPTTIDLSQTTFFNNQQAYAGNSGIMTGGGGVAVGRLCELDVSHTMFRMNGSVLEGGGMVVRGGTAVGSNLILTHNIGSNAGGAIAIGEPQGDTADFGQSSLSLQFTSAIGNESFALGGGLSIGHDADVTLSHVLLEGNAVTSFGQGFDVWSTAASTVSTTVDYTGIETAPSGPSGAPNPFSWTDGQDGNFLFTGSLVDDSPSTQAPGYGNFHLVEQTGSASDGVDEGSLDSGYLDPDGSRADIGAYGGPYADDWDRDGDGDPEYWQPNTYLSAYQVDGLDCDDFREWINSAQGCDVSLW